MFIRVRVKRRRASIRVTSPRVSDRDAIARTWIGSQMSVHEAVSGIGFEEQLCGDGRFPRALNHLVMMPILRPACLHRSRPCRELPQGLAWLFGEIESDFVSGSL